MSIKGSIQEFFARLTGDRARALHVAAATGQLSRVDELLEAGADVDALDVFGAAPLYYAAHAGNAQVVEALLNSGASIDVRVGPSRTRRRDSGIWYSSMPLGETPLFAAIESGSMKVLRLLLERGAEVNLRDGGFGYTPLHYAARNSTAEMVQALIDAGATVDAVDGLACTALHVARGDDLEILEALVKAGADVNAPGHAMVGSVLEEAIKNEHYATARFLREHGATEPPPKQED
jgi:ankyrin repeat protein